MAVDCITVNIDATLVTLTMEQLTQIDPILRLAQTSKRPVREDVEGSVAKVYRNLGTISARSLQAICGSEWCAEWKPSGSGMTLYVGNGAALPSQPEIHQVSAADCLNTLYAPARLGSHLSSAASQTCEAR